MSVSGISSSSLFNYESASLQNQQQWQQEFQKLGQELQSANIPVGQGSAPITAQAQLATLQPQSLQTGATALSQSSDPITTSLIPSQGTHTPGTHLHLHHRVRVGASNDSDSATTPDSDPFAQPLPSTTSSSAQQAYTSWQQDLQQVALNSDLLTAQSAAWQPLPTNVSLSA